MKKADLINQISTFPVLCALWVFFILGIISCKSSLLFFSLINVFFTIFLKLDVEKNCFNLPVTEMPLTAHCTSCYGTCKSYLISHKQLSVSRDELY